MADLKPVSPGQPLRISAGDYNAMLEVTRAFKAKQLAQEASGGALLPSGVVMVQNNSGANRDALDILAINAPLILPTESLDRWRSAVTFDAVTPGSTHTGRYVVLQEPIAAGRIGRAMVIGVTPVNLDVTADADRFAELAVGVTATLKTGTTGSARILWKESGTGTKRGVVMLTGETPAVPPHVDTVNPTVNDDSADGYQVGAIWINTTTKQYFIATDVTVGAAVWAVQMPKPSEDGTVLCSKSDLSGGEWVMVIDIGRNAVGKAGKIQILSPDASGVAIEIDASLVTASSKKLTIREEDACDNSGALKKRLIIASALY